ncbi:MAG: hypothetical protein RL219_2076, partial [Actinomycetota bacterium]
CGCRPTLAVMRSPAELTEAFRQRGLKVTPQRQLIFRLLDQNCAHPSAEALFEAASSAMPGISLRTVYQTLNDLAEMGELRLLDLGTGAARFDPNVGDHHHLVCNNCGEVRDVHVRGSEHLEPSETNHGFVLDAAEIVFRGQCARCAAGFTPS